MFTFNISVSFKQLKAVAQFILHLINFEYEGPMLPSRGNHTRGENMHLQPQTMAEIKQNRKYLRGYNSFNHFKRPNVLL